MIKIALTEVSIDSDLQPRAMITESIVEEYAEAMSNGSSFPPITVFSDGEKNWLADGYHRFHAARKAGLDKISAEFRTGTKLDALKYALSANTKHGLRRSQEDRKRAVLIALREFGSHSNREIARMVSVDDKTVAKYRTESNGNALRRNSAHSKEVFNFFNEYLWLTTEALEIFESDLKVLRPGYADSLKHVVIPEVRRCVHKLKELGLQKIDGPIAIIGTDPRGIEIEISSLNGRIWWAFVSDRRHVQIDSDGEEVGGQYYTNSQHQRGFDSLISWLFANGGMDVLPSHMAELRLDLPPDLDKEDFPYWDNIFCPEVAKCAGCGKEARRWGKEGMRQLKSGLFCPTCYPLQPTEIINGKEVPKSV